MRSETRQSSVRATGKGIPRETGSGRGSAQDAGPRLKVARWPARLSVDGTTVDARAVQIAPNGIGLITTRSVRDGQQCTVQINALVQGQTVRLQAAGTVISCTCIGMEGFRVSLRFQALDAAASSAIETLLQTR